MPQTEPMTPVDYVKFYNDVKIHFEMLCTDRMRRHAYADPVAHDLAFQIFRILSGYEQALEEIAQRDRALLEAAAERGKIIPIEMLREAGNAGFASSHYDETVTDEEYATIAKRFGYILAPLEKEKGNADNQG